MHPGRRLVVDASVVAKWHLPDEDDLAPANELLIHVVRRDVVIMAPDVIWSEVGSAISNSTRGRAPRHDAASGETEITRLLRLALEIYSCRDLLISAHRLAHQFDCAFYDSLYVALANRYDVPFITADYRLYRRIAHLPEIIWLGDYTSVR